MSVFLAFAALPARADEGAHALRDAQALYASGQYFKAARYAFSAKGQNPALTAEADSWITLGLVKARLYNSASYFFIKTLETKNKAAIRRVLTQLEELLVHVGPDLLRKYLIRNTTYDDYDAVNRSAFLYALGKEAILSHQEEKAIGYLSALHQKSPLWPYALQLRGSAQAILGRNERALEDFRSCQDRAEGVIPGGAIDAAFARQVAREAEDLKARCTADEARTLYQMERFDDADQAYDRISKGSIVWPDILFEQAWNAFARQEYNRSLGKLVSYKSPALKYVFNPEIDVLRAQSFLALCLYSDANGAINDFNARYSQVGEQIKRFVEQNSTNLPAFHELGKQALRNSLYTPNEVLRLSDRFVRGPYFRGLVVAEASTVSELAAIRQFNKMQPGADPDPSHGFPGFLAHVLVWRSHAIKLLGGAFVKNSLMDYHAELLSNFDKMSFIKLEMLKRAKEQLVYRNRLGDDRSRGNVEPSRRDYQYYWNFNGEFWNDELGDYVFGLESECGGKSGA